MLNEGLLSRIKYIHLFLRMYLYLNKQLVQSYFVHSSGRKTQRRVFDISFAIATTLNHRSCWEWKLAPIIEINFLTIKEQACLFATTHVRRNRACIRNANTVQSVRALLLLYKHTLSHSQRDRGGGGNIFDLGRLAFTLCHFHSERKEERKRN